MLMVRDLAEIRPRTQLGAGPPCGAVSFREVGETAQRPARPQTRGLPVGVGSAVGFLPGDIAVSLCATHSLLRFSEVAPSGASPLRCTPLATSHRHGYEKNHDDDRDQDRRKGARDEPPASPNGGVP
jgi:hypothetical protein